MSDREHYIPNLAFGIKAQQRACKLAGQEMRDAISLARAKGWVFEGEKPLATKLIPVIIECRPSKEEIE